MTKELYDSFASDSEAYQYMLTMGEVDMSKEEVIVELNRLNAEIAEMRERVKDIVSSYSKVAVSAKILKEIIDEQRSVVEEN